MKISLPAAALLWAFPHMATAQVAILHIQVIEGEGAVNAPGSRSARPMAVQVTDETGQPVEGAALSFHLPEEGPGGTFANGLRTEVAITDARGRATLRTLQLNRTPGRFPIRIVASKEQARAGLVSFQYIAEATASSRASRTAPAASRTAPAASRTAPAASRTAPAASRTAPAASRRVLKWVALAALAGGAMTVGAIVAGRSSGASSTSAAPAGTTTTAISITIGTPSLTVGKP